jgi:GNAT superfamily N-acetyltransferase
VWRGKGEKLTECSFRVAAGWVVRAGRPPILPGAKFCYVQRMTLPPTQRPPAPVTFRRATDLDRPAVETLQHAAYARNRRLLGVEPLPLQADYAEIFRSMEVWLAEERDQLRGVLILEPRVDDMLIWSIAATPEAQKQGVGHIMLDAAEVRAKQLGRTTMRLYTGAVLEGLIRWYHHHGYKIERQEQLSDRRITHMIKPLPRDHG